MPGLLETQKQTLRLQNAFHLLHFGSEDRGRKGGGRCLLVPTQDSGSVHSEH